MSDEQKDICDRLFVAVPYGLEDYNVLRDARNEILRLREELSKLEKPE